MARVRLLRDGQVTLPAALRQKLNLTEGDWLDAELVEDGLLLKPLSARERERFRRRAKFHVRRNPHGHRFQHDL